MNLDNYEEFVNGLMSPPSVANFSSMLDVSVYGLSGEVGEYADCLKKLKFHRETVYDETELDEETRAKLIKELGDVMFYLAFAATAVCKSSLQEIIDTNVEKLKHRYKDSKFTYLEFVAKELAKNE